MRRSLVRVRYCGSSVRTLRCRPSRRRLLPRGLPFRTHRRKYRDSIVQQGQETDARGVCRARANLLLWLRLSENTVDLESCGYHPKSSKRARQLEWEHVVPAEAFGQSFPEWREGHPECVDRKGQPFKGRNCARKVAVPFRYMEADLYNLQPAIGEVNHLRLNYSMAMIPGEARAFGRCDLEIEDRKIEPRPDIRGTSPGPTSTWMPPTLGAASSPRKTKSSLRHGTQKTRWITGSASGYDALSSFRATRIRL